MDGRVLIDKLPVSLMVHTDLDRAVRSGQIHQKPADLYTLSAMRRVRFLAD